MDSSFLDREHSADERGKGKRGRKQTLPDPAQGPVARFAHELSELKQAAGDPSYDRMRSELGAAASKSALSAAARGQSLPSWETTWEFVRSLAVGQLGQDEDTVRRTWRLSWEQAEAAGRAPAVESPPAPQRTGATEVARSDERASEAQPVRGTPWALRNPQAGVAAVLVAVVGVTLAVLAITGRIPAGRSSPPPAAPPQYPLPGDNSFLVREQGMPDGSIVHVGQSFPRSWVVKNIGNVVWQGRFLKAFGDTTTLCQVPEQVPIPRTAPGETVEIPVTVTAKTEGTCHVVWKMVDDKGQLFFPNQLRPVFFEVRVQR